MLRLTLSEIKNFKPGSNDEIAIEVNGQIVKYSEILRPFSVLIDNSGPTTAQVKLIGKGPISVKVIAQFKPLPEPTTTTTSQPLTGNILQLVKLYHLCLIILNLLGLSTLLKKVEIGLRNIWGDSVQLKRFFYLLKGYFAAFNPLSPLIQNR